MRMLLGLLLVFYFPGIARSAEPTRIDVADGRLTFHVGGVPIATYVYRDPNILRPYFCQLKSLAGRQLTREHPPRDGVEATDHAEMHPGVWLAFGDLGGGDFWRNKARVEHIGFVDEPKQTSDGFVFRVRQRYRQGDRSLCEELCTHRLQVADGGWWLEYDSRFQASQTLAFGDQEEMGLGVRMAGPLCVKGGTGQILNSHGDRNEAAAWGKPAVWCDYSANIDGRRAGILLVPDPENPWPSRFHVRDYGLMVANPIGQKAFRVSEPASRQIPAARPIRLRFRLFIHDLSAGDPLDLSEIAKDVR